MSERFSTFMILRYKLTPKRYVLGDVACDLYLGGAEQ